MKQKRLELEHLEARLLLAAPSEPLSLGLWYADDSGPCGSVTDSDTEVLKLAAAAGNTVKIYNISDAGYLDDATDTGETVWLEAGGEVTIEAENGALSGWQTTAGGGSQGSYISDNNTNGDGIYHFYVTTPGTYYVHARTSYPNSSSNSFYINIDDVWTNPETGPGVWSTAAGWNNWHFDTAVEVVNQAAVKTWTLAAGWHFLEVHTREDDAKLDRIVLSTNPVAPVDPGGAESTSSGLYTYDFDVGDLVGSETGTANYIIATATNGLDETSDPSSVFTITYDNADPAKPGTPDLDSSDDSGSDDADDNTSVTGPTITGTAEANSTINIDINAGTQTDTVVVGVDGSWTYDITGGWLNEDVNTIFVTATDAAGNTSIASDNLVITLDTTDPALAAVPDLDTASDTGYAELPGFDTDDLTNDTTATFVWAAGSVDNSMQVDLRLGAATLAATTANGDGSYSITVAAGDLAEGDNDVYIRVTDTAGNTLDSGTLTVTLDTTAAAPGVAPDLEAASDSGTNNDNVTNDDTATFTGPAATVPNNAKVYLRVNGINKRSTTTTPDGSYSVTLQAGDLVEGANVVDIIYVDPAGNTSGDSADLTVTLDTVLATPAAPDLRAASDTGSVDTDNITSDDAAWFDGFAEPGATVQLFVGAAGKDTDVADAVTGAWSIQLNNGDLAAGANNITVTATDTAGNTDTSAALVVTFDDAGPAQPGTPDLSSSDDSGSDNADDITNITDPTITGTAEANTTINIDINAGTHTDTVSVNANGNWIYDITNGWLNEGINTIFVTATDSSGFTSVASDNLVITLDTTDPALATVPDLDTSSDTGYAELPGFDTDDLTNDTTATFVGAAGSVDNNMLVSLRLGAATLAATAANGDGSYSITVSAGDLAEGDNDVYIRVTDTAGNTLDSGTLTVTLDTTANAPGVAPDLEAACDSGTNNDNITNITTPTFTGPAATVPNNSKVYLRVNGVNKRSTTTTPDGSYSVTLQAGDLVEGANVVDIIYVDPAGNTSGDSADLTVTLDTILATPAVPDLRAASDTGSSNKDNITSDDAAWFDGFAEPGATVQLFVEAAGKGTDTADAATGAWSIQLNNGDLAVGDNDLTTTATDTAGNTATSEILIVTYDGGGAVPNAPLLQTSSDSGSSDADGITYVAAGTVYGSVADGNEVEGSATVHVRTNKNGGGWTDAGTTVADSSGNWSYTFDAVDDLDEGTNLVDVYITDLAGFDSVASDDLTIVLDTAANTPAAAPDLEALSDTGSDDTDNITSETAPTFNGGNGSVEANATVWLRVDGSNVRSEAADGAGAYSISLLEGDVAEGSHLIDVIFIDTAGNTSGDSPDLSITLDTQTAVPDAPDLDAASDTGSSAGDNLTYDTTATFYGLANSVEGNSTVYLRVGGVDKRSTTANADGSYSITVQAGDLVTGANQVDIYYQDQAGNIAANGPDLTVTLDTTIDDPVLPDLADISDTGSNTTDDITAETRPTIQGAAGSVEGLSTVRVWLDTPGAADTEVGTATAAADGSWNYTFTSVNPLEEGANIIHVIAVDPAGNISNSSPNLTVTVDFGAGAQSAPDLDAASDTGAADDDDITSDNTPTISAACPNGAVIKLRTNAVIMATFTDNDADDDNPAAGFWSYTFEAGDLNEGVNTIAFLTIDTQNNTSDWSQDLVITQDTGIQQPEQPNLITADDSGSDTGDDITNVTSPRISGTAEANSTVTIDINDGAQSDTAAVGANGAWSYTLTNGWLNEGANTIFVQATDVAGNVSVVSTDLIITLDTTNNAPSQPDLTAATDTGGSNTDNITRHANPRIVGAADANTTIAVRLDPDGAATIVGTTTADALGNWSYTFAGDDLAEGANIIDVLSTDIADNSIDSANLTISIETAINAPQNLDLTAGSDLGDANDDDLTSLTTATITGTADSSCTVYVRVNGTEIGSATSDGVGDWSYTFDGVDDLIEGVNIVDAYAEDSVGNLSAYSDDLVITLDTLVATPAAVDLATAGDSGVSDVDNYTNVATATISGACETGAAITISLNGDDNFATVTDDADGSEDGLWSYTFAAGLNGSTDGTANTIKVTQQDPAGNSSAFGPVLIVTLDDAADTPTTPDLLTISDSGDAGDDNLTNISNITITGSVETNSSLQLYVNQGAGAILVDTISEQLISTGTWSYTFASGQLIQGSNQITVIAIDKANNISPASTPLVVTLDTTINQPGLPDLTDASDTGDFTNDEITSDETPTFVGLADPYIHVTIRVDGESINTVDADAAGSWSYTFAQGEVQTGVHRIDVIATDIAGNVSVPSDDLTIWLNVEPTQPAGPNLLADSDSGSISTDNLTNVTTATIAGKADAERTVFIYTDDELVGATIADANGFWEFSLSDGDITEGDNEVTIITEDSSGLRSSASYPLTINLDTTAPDAPLPDLQATSDTGVSHSDNLTSDETATIEGSTEPSALINLYHNGAHLTQLTAAVAGNWSYTFAPGVLVVGNNEVYLTVTDVAGNTSDISEVLNIILDVQQDAPDAPVISPDTDTGSQDNDGLTSDPTPDILGTVKPDSSVEIRVSGTSAATVPADDQGNWQYTFEPEQLNEGVNYVEIISTDPVGNSARSAVLELTLDTVAPVLYNYFPRGVHTHVTQIIELYINGADLDALAAYDTTGYQLLGAGGDGTFDDGNEWIIPISSVTIDTIAGLVQVNAIINLTDDDYQFVIDPAVSLHDQAGNATQLNLSGSSCQDAIPLAQNEPIILEFTIDTEGPPAPTAPQLDPASDSGGDDSDNITNCTNPLVHITADPDITVELLCNGRSAGFANENQPGVYSLIVENNLLRAGENMLLARAFDALGNSSDLSESQTFIFDQQGPEVAAIVVDSLWLNFGPTQITTVFSQTDTDPATIGDLDSYILLGSGGDGNFDDGNEITVTPVGMSYNSSTRSVILTLPQTVAGNSQLGPDTYRLTVSADGPITDMAGNSMTVSSPQDFIVVPAETIHSNEQYRFTTSSQTSVTIALEGQGDAVILLGEDVGTENTIEKIVLSNTNENTRLIVKSSKKQSPVSVGQILVDSPIKTIKARHVSVTVTIDVSQGISRLDVGDISADALLNLTSRVAADDAASDSGLEIDAGNIGQNVQFNIEGQVKLLRATAYDQGSFTADSVHAIKIKTGNMGADINVLEGDLNYLKVYKGDMTGAIDVAGQIARVIVSRGLLTGDITAGDIQSVSALELDGVKIRADQNIGLVQAAAADSVSISAGNDLGRIKIKTNLADSTISAGRNISGILVQGDALDNLLLAGSDLGSDGQLDGVEDQFASGNLERLAVTGSYLNTIAAAAVNPGADLSFFSADDQTASVGYINKVKFGSASLNQTIADNPFGLLAGGAITPFRLNGVMYEAPLVIDQFRLEIVE